MTVGPFYVVETTLNPGVQYNVGQAEMEHLLELGVLIGGAPAPAEVLDSQLATLINDVNSLVHAAVEQFPPGPHTHVSADLSESGSTGRALLATTSAVSARAAIGAGTSSLVLGTTAGTAAEGNDLRLSDARSATDASVAALVPGPSVTADALRAAFGTDAGDPQRTELDAAYDPAGAATAAQTHAVQRANHTGAQAISTVTGLQTALDGKAASTITANVQTGTSYTLVLADAGKAVEMNNAAANTVTVPPNSSVAFPVGTVVEVFQVGAGQTTVQAGSGVTLRAPDGAKLAKQYASGSLRKRGTDEWVLAGNVTA